MWRECLVAAAELLAPDKVNLIRKNYFVPDRITDLARYIEKTERFRKRFLIFFLACDETAHNK